MTFVVFLVREGNYIIHRFLFVIFLYDGILTVSNFTLNGTIAMVYVVVTLRGGMFATALAFSGAGVVLGRFYGLWLGGVNCHARYMVLAWGYEWYHRDRGSVYAYLVFFNGYFIVVI